MNASTTHPNATGLSPLIIEDLDVRTLADGDPVFQALRDGLYQHSLITLRGQDLTPAEYVAFCHKLGRPQIYFQDNYHHPDHPEIFVSSNVNKPGEKVGVAGTGRYWHTDCAFETKPLSLTAILPQIFPKTRRETFYINMAHVWASLPEHLAVQVRHAVAVHEGKMRYKIQACDIDLSLAEVLDRIHREVPPVRHPAVIQHPVTGREILYMSSGFTTQIEGLGYEENQQLLAELFAFIERPEHVFTHTWQEGDLIIWDNRMLNHKASTLPPGEKSKSYRIGIYDGLPFYQGLTP